MKYQNNKDLAEAQYYLKMLGDFCKTGQVIIPDSPQNAMPWNTQEDPLKDYLIKRKCLSLMMNLLQSFHCR